MKINEQELAEKINAMVALNPKTSRVDVCNRFHVGRLRVEKMEAAGMIPKLYRMSASERGRKGRKNGGWRQGLCFGKFSG